MSQNLTSNVRVRFAPSPTGFLHIGGLRTALYNYLFARRHGGSFIVRIEDTDQIRAVEGAVENLLATLHTIGIDPDEGPFYQSKRLELYQKHAHELVGQGYAYYCTCSSERLDQVRQAQMASKQPPMYDGHCRNLDLTLNDLGVKSFVVRLKVPEQGSVSFRDMIRGDVVFNYAEVDDQVLLKSDGFPTYHLAVVVDDHDMKISHVIRGEEWISSTPKHLLLYEVLGWNPPEFAHLPLLLNSDRSKLSKRQGYVAVEDYFKKGFLPEALLNFVALLGWNPSADQEIFTVQELIESFDLHKVNKGGAVVNFEKLEWLNGHYIRQTPIEKLVELCIPYLTEAGYVQQSSVDRSWLGQIVALEQERLKKLSDIAEGTEFFFKEPEYDAAVLCWKTMDLKTVGERLGFLVQLLQEVEADDWGRENLESIIKNALTDKGISTGEALWPMRVALSGRHASPPPFAIADILGKEKTLARLEHAISKTDSPH